MLNWALLSANEFTVIDIETTGFSPLKGGRIIEIGAIKIKEGKIIDKFSTFINPQVKIPKKITEITRISDDMVKDSPTLWVVLRDFYKFIGNSVIVAHNVRFDWNTFLQNNFKKIGINACNQTIDTIDLSKETFKDKTRHNLKDMCSYLNIEVKGHHRAIEDAVMTANAFLKFLEIHKDKIENKEYSNQMAFTDNVTDISIKRIKYWEKETSNNLFQRLYVNLFYDSKFLSVYFDIVSKCWFVKEKGTFVNFDLVEKSVLEFLSLENVEALCSFRN